MNHPFLKKFACKFYCSNFLLPIFCLVLYILGYDDLFVLEASTIFVLNWFWSSIFSVKLKCRKCFVWSVLVLLTWEVRSQNGTKYYCIHERFILWVAVMVRLCSLAPTRHCHGSHRAPVDLLLGLQGIFDCGARIPYDWLFWLRCWQISVSYCTYGLVSVAVLCCCSEWIGVYIYR